MEFIFDTQGRIQTPILELLVLVIGFVWIGIWIQGAYPEEDDG